MDTEKPQRPVMDVMAPPVRPAPALPDDTTARAVEPAPAAEQESNAANKPQLPKNHRASSAGIVAATLLVVAALASLTIWVYVKSR